jgi:hypothetical protein
MKQKPIDPGSFRECWRYMNLQGEDEERAGDREQDTLQILCPKRCDLVPF